MSSMDRDLTVIFPGVNVKIGEQTHRVNPFSMGNVLTCAGIIGELIDFFVNQPVEMTAVFDDGDWKSNPATLPIMAQVMELFGDKILQLVSMSCPSLSEEDIRNMNPAVGLGLISVVFEVNYDFFTNHFKPIMKTMMSKTSQMKSDLLEGSPNQ